jgi:orotate phosphoribosyltransferase
MSDAKKIAEILLDTESVHLKGNPDDFFTWTSGIRSPIYCDNRQLISYPEHRKFISQCFAKTVQDAQIIAGTATAGIPWGAWVADELSLPMIYIRSKAKAHGLKNCIEGKMIKDAKVAIIEDLISTGKSSIHAANEVIKDGMQVSKIYSIFSYNLNIAESNFKSHNSEYISLCSLEDLLEVAQERGIINSQEVETIRQWKETLQLS